MKIAVVTTLWKRDALERIVLRYYRDLKLDGIQLILVAAGSEGRASMERACDNGWHYVEAPNDPLSDKWNHALSAARLYDPDGVVIIGSDDLLNKAYFKVIAEEAKSQAGVIQLYDAYFYDTASGEAVYMPRCNPGAGTYVKSDILERTGWRLWRSGHNRNLDREMSNYVRREAYPFEWRTIRDCESRDVVMLDVKTSVNMWSLDDNKRLTGNRQVQRDGPELLTKHFPTVYGKIKSLTS